MFWDSVLDPVRNSLSNDLVRWLIASIVASFVLTKLLSISAGSSMETRQELNVGAMIFLLLVGVFYLP